MGAAAGTCVGKSRTLLGGPHVPVFGLTLLGFFHQAKQISFTRTSSSEPKFGFPVLNWHLLGSYLYYLPSEHLWVYTYTFVWKDAVYVHKH